MILIVVKMPVKPEYADEWPSLIAEFTAATRAEPGNISFEWFRSVDDPTVYTLVETFRDGDAGAAHVQTEHFAAAMEQMPSLLSAVPDIIHINSDDVAGWSKMAELSPEG